MKKKELVVIQVPLDKLITKFYVRTRLDQDWVLHLALLYEAGEKIDPLEVRKVGNSFEIISGRNRSMAMNLAGIKMANCVVLEQCSDVKAQSIAFQSNIVGLGPLPLKKKDIVFSLSNMFDSGMRWAQIEALMPWSKATRSRYMRDAKSNVKKRQVSRAVEYLKQRKQSTIESAARKFKIKVEDIVSASQKAKNTPIGFPELKGSMTTQTRRIQRFIANSSCRLREALEEQEATVSQVEDFLDHASTVCEILIKTIKEEKFRLKFVSKGVIQ